MNTPNVMSQQEGMLNLSQHSIEAIPGKTARINGQWYEFVELIGEGGEGWVYALRNVQSKLIKFVAKLYKEKPGSEAYIERMERHCSEDFGIKMFEMQSILGAYAREEPYEIGGGLFGFMKCLTDVPNADCHFDAMKHAQAYSDAKHYKKAIDTYDQVLALNPHHTDALLNKLVASFNNGDGSHLLHLGELAIKIEPNDSLLYLTTARIATALGMPKAAMQCLDWALRRYQWDYECYVELTNIAVSFDFVDIAVPLIGKIRRICPGIKKFQQFESELKRSRVRRSEYLDHLHKAAELQKTGNWSSAASECEIAEHSSLDNSIASLSRYVSLYHLGRGRSIADKMAEVLYRLPNLYVPSCALLAALCYAELGALEEASSFMLLLDVTPTSPFDMPGIPVMISDDTLREEKSCAKVIQMLKSFKPRPSEAEMKKLQELITVYEQRERT